MFTDAKRLAADHQEPAVQRLQVHASRAGDADRPAGQNQAGALTTRPEPSLGSAGLLGVGHRHRHPAGQAADHLRGVPASRRLDQPQVRRHRPGPGDQPRTVASAGRRNSLWRPAGRGSNFTLYLPLNYTPRSARKTAAASETSATGTINRIGARIWTNRCRPKRATRTEPMALYPWWRRSSEACRIGPSLPGQRSGDDRDDIRPAIACC